MKKPNRRQQEAEARRAADPLSEKVGRDDIDYAHEDLPPAPRYPIVTTPAPPANVVRELLNQVPRCEDRIFRFRTPTRCQNGHLRFLFYSISFGRCDPTLWAPQTCGCPTGEIGEGFSKCGPEQQFTGLRDSKGVELFEGDIVDHLKYGSLHEVVWFAESAGFFLRKQGDGTVMALSSLCQQYLEIVGNIHE